MENNDLEFIYNQLKNNFPLVLTNTFALDVGFTIDVPVLCGESKLGKFYLYKEHDCAYEFVFSVEFATPRKSRWYLHKEKYTH